MQLRLKLGLSNQAGNFLRFFYCQCGQQEFLSKRMFLQVQHDITNPTVILKFCQTELVEVFINAANNG